MLAVLYLITKRLCLLVIKGIKVDLQKGREKLSISSRGSCLFGETSMQTNQYIYITALATVELQGQCQANTSEEAVESLEEPKRHCRALSRSVNVVRWLTTS